MGNLRSSLTPSSQAGPTLGSHLVLPPCTWAPLTPAPGPHFRPPGLVSRSVLRHWWPESLFLPHPPLRAKAQESHANYCFDGPQPRRPLSNLRDPRPFSSSTLRSAAFSDSPSTHPSGEQQQVSRQAPRPRGSRRREWGSRVSCGAGDRESRPGRIAGGQDASQEKAVRYLCHQALRGTLDKRELRAPRVFGGISVGSAGKLGRRGRPRPAPRKRAAKK